MVCWISWPGWKADDERRSGTRRHIGCVPGSGVALPDKGDRGWMSTSRIEPASGRSPGAVNGVTAGWADRTSFAGRYASGRASPHCCLRVGSFMFTRDDGVVEAVVRQARV